VPRFKELTTETILQILEAKNAAGELLYPDVLTPLSQKRAEQFQNAACPKCKASSTWPILDTQRPFTPGSPLPNMRLRCTVCGTEFDPRTGLITLANITDVSG